jgi:hypothetical protein
MFGSVRFRAAMCEYYLLGSLYASTFLTVPSQGDPAMKKFAFRYVSPVMTARTITQAEKDQSAERRRRQRLNRPLRTGS